MMTLEQAEEQLATAREANANGNYEIAERLANHILSDMEPFEVKYSDALLVLAESGRLQGNFAQVQIHAEAALALAPGPSASRCRDLCLFKFILCVILRTKYHVICNSS